jgi:hypothetical protein
MASHLEALRADLPARVAASAAGNGAMYIRRVEEGYRQFWRDYCAAISLPTDRTPDRPCIAFPAISRRRVRPASIVF